MAVRDVFGLALSTGLQASLPRRLEATGRAIMGRLAPEPVSPLGAVHLLADLLEALEHACDTLLSMAYEPARFARNDQADAILVHSADLRDFLDQLETHELAIAAKLARARLWADMIGRSDERLRRFAGLFLAGTNAIADQLPQLADPSESIFNKGGQQIAFLSSRGLIGDVRATADGSVPIAIGRDYLLCGLTPIGALADLTTSTLNALDAHYGVYEAEAEVDGASRDLTVAEPEQSETILLDPIELTIDEAADALIEAAERVKQFGQVRHEIIEDEATAAASSHGATTASIRSEFVVPKAGDSTTDLQALAQMPPEDDPAQAIEPDGLTEGEVATVPPEPIGIAGERSTDEAEVEELSSLAGIPPIDDGSAPTALASQQEVSAKPAALERDASAKAAATDAVEETTAVTSIAEAGDALQVADKLEELRLEDTALDFATVVGSALTVETPEPQAGTAQREANESVSAAPPVESADAVERPDDDARAEAEVEVEAEVQADAPAKPPESTVTVTDGSDDGSNDLTPFAVAANQADSTAAAAPEPGKSLADRLAAAQRVS